MGSISWWGEPPEDPYSPCPCGSGKKYKFCCRDKERAQPVTPQAAWPLDDDGEKVVTPLPAAGAAFTEDDFARCMRLDQQGQRLMVRGDYAAAIRKYQAAIMAAVW